MEKHEISKWEKWAFVIISGALIAGLGWAGHWTLEWAARARQMDVNTEDIRVIKVETLPEVFRELKDLPSSTVTRKEHEDLKEEFSNEAKAIEQQHGEMIQGLRDLRREDDHINSRIDEIMAMLSKLRADLKRNNPDDTKGMIYVDGPYSPAERELR